MSKKICLAQTISELNFILKKTNKELVCIPLNLEVLLFCKLNKINFIDPISLLDNNFHKNSIETVDEFIKSVKFTNQLDYNIKIEFLGWLRFRTQSILFVDQLLSKINEKEGIHEIYLSGWKQTNFKNLEGYFLLSMADFFEKKYKIKKVSHDIIKSDQNNFYNFYIKNIKKNRKKNILLNNISYNFKRFVINKNRRNYNFFFLNEKKLSFFEKVIFSYLNVNPLNIGQRQTLNKRSHINYEIINQERFFFLKTLKIMMADFHAYFHNLEEKNLAVENFLKKNRIDLILSNIVRGFSGSAIEIGEKLNLKTVCITHGTIAPEFNKYDKIYKKIIAESVFSGNSKNFAIQSKICDHSLKTHKIKGKKIYSGNINFSQNKKNNFKDYAIYAVTLKDFFNLQFYGVEMFYEFNDNLKRLNEMSATWNIKIIVKVHPSQNHCVDNLKKIYKNLIFSKKKNRKFIKKKFCNNHFFIYCN